MGKTRKMRLVAFLKTGPTAHHHGMWRHPETDNDFLDPAWYEHVARVLEKGKFDCLFFADTLGLFDNYRGNFDAILKGGGQMGFLDPLPVLAVMSRVTRHIGLGATLSTTFHNPYQIARTLGTLDVLSEGRMAWNVVSSISNLEARNFGQDELPPRNLRYDRADEVMEACFKLWESWEPDALIVDKESGVFADPSKVHYVDYAGKWIKTRGPLTVPRSPQGHPVIMQAGASDRGRDFAARWSEMIFTLQYSKADMQAFYSDIKQRVAKFGRPPEDCAVLPSVDPIIGETESIAREKQAYINEHGRSRGGAGAGLDAYRRRPVEISDRPAAAGHRDRAGRARLVRGHPAGHQAHGLTLGEAAKRFATSELCPQIVGTPKSVADQLQDYFESQACDGFILTPTVFPGTWEQFARSVVPELQRRGLFRTDYTGRTLREHLHD